MREDPLDRVLSSDEALVPSAGFTARVMDAVQRVAAEPPPLAFPWGRFTAGLITILLSAALGLWLLQRLDLSPMLVRLTDLHSELGYAAAAIAGTLAMLCADRLRTAMWRLLASRAPWNVPPA